ncbi:MAG: hypothetical protein ACON39_00795 [Coraliomargaritaceae bacterium]
MDNIFEILVPLIFAAIYFFGNMMSKKEEDVPTPKKRRQPTAEEEAVQARQKEIQEAIRRKILERRGGPKGPSGMPRPSRPTGSANGESRDIKPVVMTPQEIEPTATAPASGEFSWDASGNAYQQQLEERERQIEATRKQAEAIRQQAPAFPASTYGAKKRPRPSRSRFSGPLRSRLNKPGDARLGILYAEVLGPPIGLGGRTRIPSDR